MVHKKINSFLPCRVDDHDVAASQCSETLIKIMLVQNTNLIHHKVHTEGEN